MELQKILLVDDDKSFIYLNRKMFKYSDVTCQIDECSNGQEALTYLATAEKLPDVILLDVNMPVMDGFEFLKKVEEVTFSRKQPKVFLLSSSGAAEERSRAFNYRFVKGYFEKPLTDKHIQQILGLFNAPVNIQDPAKATLKVEV